MADPRITAARPELASRRLEGLLAAAAFVDPEPMVCVRPATSLRRAPGPAAEQLDQLLFGEGFDVLEAKGAFAWGQARRDGYVGFVERAALAPAGPHPTHRVAAIRTHAFAEPDIKSRSSGPYSINALVAEEGREGRFVKAAGGGWFVEEHLAPIGRFEIDPAGVAERFLGAAYLWGGRESTGLDCSGLVQQAFFACGRACPRDSDQQEAAFAVAVAPEDLARGDLVFWEGHVAMAVDGARILHANAHHMAAVVEPLDAAIARILKAGGGEPRAFRRP